MRLLIFGNSGSGKTTRARAAAREHGIERLDLDSIVWEPHKYASAAEQDGMLDALQEWVRGYYVRDDAWSYRAHRRIFDAHTGEKTELT